MYDAVSNFLQMQHRGSDPAHRAGRARYDYPETSLIENGSGGAEDQQPPYPHHAQPPTALTRHRPSLPGPTPTATWCACRTWAADARAAQRALRTARTSCAGPIWVAAARPASSTTPQASVCTRCGKRRQALPKSASTSAASKSSAEHGGAMGANTATLERETLHIMGDKQQAIRCWRRAMALFCVCVSRLIRIALPILARARNRVHLFRLRDLGEASSGARPPPASTWPGALCCRSASASRRRRTRRDPVSGNTTAGSSKRNTRCSTTTQVVPDVKEAAAQASGAFEADGLRAAANRGTAVVAAAASGGGGQGGSAQASASCFLGCVRRSRRATRA